MSYNEHLLPSLNSSKQKEALILHDGEIKERVCILLWQYIVTLEHGTHLHMHFSTWVICLSSSLANSYCLLTLLSCPRILSQLVALGYCYHSRVNTAKSCHSHVQEKFGHLFNVYNQFTFYHVHHPWFSFVHHFVFWFTPKHIWSCFMSMMGDSSWPSFNWSIPVDLNSLSPN